MISAWDIYWVMQLDRIGGFLFAATLIAATFGGIALLGGAMLTDCGTNRYAQDAAETWATCKKWCFRAVVFAGLIGTVSAFIPSTKTAAAMVVLPAIANNEAIQREAGDLYGIAKDALRELAKPKHEAAK